MSERAVVVGSGPNGLSGAIRLAQAGRAVTLIEAAERIGGGVSSEEATLPGFVHDRCSTVYPFGAGSPYWRALPLRAHGLEWVHAPAPLAHPLDDGHVVMMWPSVADTAEALGGDGDAYLRLLGPLVRDSGMIVRHVIGPVRVPPDPVALARFGLPALRSARSLFHRRFAGTEARALLAGCWAHSLLSLEQPATAAFGLVLALSAHAFGWPFARGGAQSLADALGSLLQSLGGRIETGRLVEDLDELPSVGTTLLDVGPWNLLEMAKGRLPERVSKAMRRYRPGPAVVKVDYALDAPVPWTAAKCGLAGTVHLGGTFDQIAASESAVASGTVHQRPFVLLTQPTLFDPSRAPKGKHVVWAYCHVPNGWTGDVSDRIDAQIERFAPGFLQRVLERRFLGPKEIEAHNPNFLGGDISTGTQAIGQLFTRPRAALNPYATGIDGVFICSAATPPGSGVHGMCGYRAALSALDSPWQSLKRRLP